MAGRQTVSNEDPGFVWKRNLKTTAWLRELLIWGGVMDLGWSVKEMSVKVMGLKTGECGVSHLP